MPDICNYYCANESCQDCNKDFSFTDVWPIGDIDDVILCDKVQQNDILKAELLVEQRYGEKYAKIPLPNNQNINKKGIRISFLDPATNQIKHYDVESGLTKLDWMRTYESINIETEGFITFYEFNNSNMNCSHCNRNLNVNRNFQAEN